MGTPSRHNQYSEFVNHPRFGSGPRYTGLEPNQTPAGCLQMGKGSHPAVAGTAVAADLERQSYSPVPVAYYFDAERRCQDCGRPFLFFAEEQKHWYEELGFSLDSDCVRCVPCRKRQQTIAQARARYEQLVTTDCRTDDETAELGECCLTLLEQKIFPKGRLETVRMVLNRLRKLDDFPSNPRFRAIACRMALLES